MKTLTVGIAGTAKNTGKTTTTMALLEYLRNSGICIGVTSIGYDGERVDNVTGLPKPRIYLEAGSFVAVSEGCLPVGSARVKVLDRTGIKTPLGEIVCGQVVKGGLMVLAGPNQSRHLREILQWMSGQRANLVMVDGALNRVAPMAETDGLILCTGASYTTDLDRLSLETHSLGVICSLPGGAKIPGAAHVEGKTVLWNRDGLLLAELPGLLLEAGCVKAMCCLAGDAGGLYCPGLVSPECLEALSELPCREGMTYVFEDPMKLVLSGGAPTAQRFVDRVSRRAGRVVFRKSLPLAAVTVNPFYPCYRYETNHYQPAFIDRDLLVSKIKCSVTVPVFDVVRDGPGGLAGALESLASGMGSRLSGNGR